MHPFPYHSAWCPACCAGGGCSGCLARVDGTYKNMLKQYFHFYFVNPDKFSGNVNLKEILKKYAEFYPVDHAGMPLDQKNNSLVNFVLDVVATTPSKEKKVKSRE